jgi:catechol 2,3-dioxygenase-like lactoylglutathione lyase family enzyme
VTDTEVSDADTLPLGVFHEVSISVPDVAASAAFYEGLGWRRVPVRAVWPHPYAALSDGALVLGLHQYRFPSPSVTCVHPGIEAALAEHRDAGMVIAFAKTGPDCFNEFGFRDPHGHMVTLLEAPTHDGPAPAPSGPAPQPLRSFLSLPASDIGLELRFWQALGAREVDGLRLASPADWPCRPLEAAGLPMAVHPASLFGRPAVVRVMEHGAADAASKQVIEAPEGTPVIRLAAA